MLNKDTHQRYERQLSHNINFIVTIFYVFYVIFRCVTKFKTTVNFTKISFLTVVHLFAANIISTANNVHSGNLIFVEISVH